MPWLFHAKPRAPSDKGIEPTITLKVPEQVRSVSVSRLACVDIDNLPEPAIGWLWFMEISKSVDSQGAGRGINAGAYFTF